MTSVESLDYSSQEWTVLFFVCRNTFSIAGCHGFLLLVQDDQRTCNVLLRGSPTNMYGDALTSLRTEYLSLSALIVGGRVHSDSDMHQHW